MRRGPDIYPGLSRAEYEAIDAVNVSSLVPFERSAAHAREQMVHPKAPTDAMNFGTAFHMAVLEPERFESSYVVPIKVDRRTNVGKAAWAAFEAEHGAKACLDAEDFRSIIVMRDAIWLHPVASALLRGGLAEACIVFVEPETGLLCKALIDHIGEFDGWTWVADLKSCADASRYAFSRTTKTLQYAPRAAFYVDGCNIVAPRERRFVWLAVEKPAPLSTFAPIAFYECDVDALAAGRARYMRWLRNYLEAKTTGEWPAYPPVIEALGPKETQWEPA
jgi:hypothetical protein